MAARIVVVALALTAHSSVTAQSPSAESFEMPSRSASWVPPLRLSVVDPLHLTASIDPERAPLNRPLTVTAPTTASHLARWLLMVGGAFIIASTLLTVVTSSLSADSCSESGAAAHQRLARAASFSMLGAGLILLVGGAFRRSNYPPSRPRRLGGAVVGTILLGVATALVFSPTQLPAIFDCINS